MKHISISLLLTTLLFPLSYDIDAQEIWSLERCVRHALENSLNVRNAELDAQFSQVSVTQSRQARYPSLDASSGAGLNFGRVVNPATNNFETENSFFSNVGLSSGMVLYQGGLITNSIRQADLDLNASREDIQQTKNNLALEVALSYLNVLFAGENLQNAQAKLNLSQAQLNQIEKMITAGTRPQSDRYDVLAQIGLDEQDIVGYQNDRELNLLSLKHLMLLEPDYPLELEKPEVSLEGMEAFENYSLASVFNAALVSQPQIRAQEMRIRSAQVGEEIARADLLPRLSLGGSVGTNYSDLDQRALGFQTERIPTPGVYINGESALFEVDQDIATGLETTPLFDQFDNNLGYGVQLSLRIPIYNNNTAKAGLSRARLTTTQQQITDQQIRQTLKTDIQNALAAARGAREALKASERAFDAAEIAYSNADRRFALGTINNYDLISARNRLDAARVNRTIAKYDYLFRAKVIEYYLGRGLTLD
ncbi:MAG TPA: TolC family protein [Saprospiraceae bacterium]|nr:TolC family protein [Saprospiraceae bacterium]